MRTSSTPTARHVRAVLVASLAALAVVGASCSSLPQLSSTPPSYAGPSAGLSARPAGTSAVPGDGPAPLLLDSDVAADDVVAIASLLRDPAIELEAITVTGTGEAHCPGGMFVVRSLVTMLRDDDIPVACGRAAPMADAEAFPDAWRAAADAGNGLHLARPRYLPDTRSAERLIVDIANAEAAAGRKLTILSTGTLTNLASALALDATLPQKIRLVSMLGAIGVPGNVQTQGATSPAEWNAHADPTAVRLVLEAGFDWTLVPLDATNSVPLTAALYSELERDHAAGPADVVFELWSRNAWMYQGGSYLWDPLAAAAARDPSLVSVRQATLRALEGAEADGGRLIEDPAGHPVTIAVGADQAAFQAALLRWLRTGAARADPFTVGGEMVISAGPGACRVQLAPSKPAPGLLQVQASPEGLAQQSVIVFELGAVRWSEVEAFAAVASTGQASPPPVMTLGSAELPPGGSATFYADVASGPLGVACVAGSFDHPTVTLAGPFEVAKP